MLDCNKTLDIEIINKINSWDIDAFYCVVEKYKDTLLRYIQRISDISLEEAENILQEVFIKAYSNINSYNNNFAFSSWLYRIAHNCVIDYHRKNKDKQTISLETQDEEYKNLLEIIPDEFDINKEITSKELQEKIKKILSKIENKYKEVLILKFIEQKDYNEISDILKIPIWTVATLINRWKKAFIIQAQKCNINNYL